VLVTEDHSIGSLFPNLIGMMDYCVLLELFHESPIGIW